MNHRTHVNFSRVFFPNLKTSEHERITSVIDSPSRAAKQLSQALGTVSTYDPRTGKMREQSPYDYLGITGVGHRRSNHDIVTASMMTYNEVGPQAIGPTIVHLLLDNMSEDMKKKVGRAERDVWEAASNYKMEQMFKADPQKYYYRYNKPKAPKPLKKNALVFANYSKTRPYYR